MKILIKGYFGFGNLGDDVLLKVTYGVVRELFPLAELFIHSNNTPNNPAYSLSPDYNNYILSLLEDKSVNLIDWKYVGSFDITINGGGGIYFDYRDGGLKYGVINCIADVVSATTLYKIEHFSRSLTGKKSRQKSAKRFGLGIGIEKFHNRAPSYIRKKSDIGSYTDLVVRDAGSLENLKRMGFRGENYSSSDSVFLTRYWRPQNLQHKQRTKPKCIGFVLMDWKDFDEVFVCCSNVANQFKLRGFDVTFFSFDANHDKNFIKYFTSKTDCRLAVWEPDKMQIIDFLSIINDQDLLITARAHGAIIGGILGIPSICIGFREKLKSIHEMFKLSSQIIPAPFTERVLLEAIEAVLSDYPERVKRVKYDVQRNEDLAYDGLDYFKTMLNG
jgi:polysaccharide pyruvyl transferase WcaK-like protein